PTAASGLESPRSADSRRSRHRGTWISDPAGATVTHPGSWTRFAPEAYPATRAVLRDVAKGLSATMAGDRFDRCGNRRNRPLGASGGKFQARQCRPIGMVPL